MYTILILQKLYVENEWKKKFKSVRIALLENLEQVPKRIRSTKHEE